MRVLMFGWEFPPHITGGLGTACYGLTNGLVSHQVHVDFVVPKAYGDEDQSKIRVVNASDVEVEFGYESSGEYWKYVNYIEVGARLIPYVSEREYFDIINKRQTHHTWEESSKGKFKYQFSGKYGSNLVDEIMKYATISASIAKDTPHDIIHAHDWLTYPCGIAAKKVSGKPLVVHIHATEFDRSGENNINTVVFDIEKQGFLAADKIIAVSYLTKNILVNKYGISADKIEVVHNAVVPKEALDLDVKRGVKDKIVTFLGRITYQKGPEYFVEAAYKILQKQKNVRFVMAGSGDLYEKMIQRVADLQIADRFHFTGFLKGENVDRMFGMSDVYVMPSVSEPFGISPLEAMRSDVPTIISKQSGVSEVLKYALKIDFWDIDDFANKIYALINYDGLSKMIKENGREEVNNLKWENAAYKIKKIYEETIG